MNVPRKEYRVVRVYCGVLGVALVGVCSGVFSARAESPRFYNLEGFGNFLDGNPETTAITEGGAIRLPPPTRERYTDPAASFSAAASLGEEVIVARVDDGQVLAIDRAGKTRVLYVAEANLVTALASQGNNLLVAVGPPAKIYRIDSAGKVKIFHTPDADYVWDMTAGEDGSLLCATGDPGTVLRIDDDGRAAKVLFAPDQAHLRTIAYDKKLGVFVGGGESGVLYRAARGKSFRALYDSGHVEITGIVVHEPYAYVAAVTGAQALAEDAGEEGNGKKRRKGADVRSQLVQVSMDGGTQVLAGSSDEAVFDVGRDSNGAILVATGATGRADPRGRLYSVEPGRREIALVYQSPSRRITHLVPLPRDAFALVSAAGGRITHMTSGVAKKGEFVTVPFDTGLNSQFGSLQVFGSWPRGTRVTAAVRTGQTNEPDDSWSSWSQEIEAPGNTRPKVPAGRHGQIRITLHGTATRSPTVHRVRLAYLRQNLPPFVREVVALRKGLALLSMPREKPKSQTISLHEQADEKLRRGEGSHSSRPASSRARQVERPGAVTLKWVAEDPNGDDMRYELMFRNSGQGDWRTLEEELEDPFYTISSSRLPDGHYQFKVEATDAPSNPDALVRRDSRESRAVLIDNSPPRIDPLKIKISGRRVTARTVVVDSVGPLVSADYSLDGRPLRPIHPDDGVLDGPGESFTIRFGELAPGPHTLTFRVRDEADNEGVGETRFRLR